MWHGCIKYILRSKKHVKATCTSVLLTICQFFVNSARRQWWAKWCPDLFWKLYHLQKSGGPARHQMSYPQEKGEFNRTIHSEILRRCVNKLLIVCRINIICLAFTMKCILELCDTVVIFFFPINYRMTLMTLKEGWYLSAVLHTKLR